jgi:hypothetical protein
MNAKAAPKAPKHLDLVDQGPPGPPSVNPFASAANLTLSVPETIEVKLVNASTLNDYEVWFLISGILGSAFTGFLVAAIQAYDQPSSGAKPWGYVMSAVTFGVLLLVAVVTALYKRFQLASKTRRVKLAVGAVHDEEGAISE